MAKRIAIQQPSYMPWLGFFEQMDFSDVFVFFDDVQYTKKSWRSRNRIRCGNVSHYLTVPVANAHRPLPLIKDARILENGWRKKHLKTLSFEYRKAPFFDEVFPFIEELVQWDTNNLCDLDIHLATRFARKVGIETPLYRSSESSPVPPPDCPSPERIVKLCEAFDCPTLYNGITAKTILDDAWFKSQGILIEYQNFDHPEYTQSGEGFISHLSILDALFCVGPQRCLELIRAGHRDPEIL